MLALLAPCPLSPLRAIYHLIHRSLRSLPFGRDNVGSDLYLSRLWNIVDGKHGVLVLFAFYNYVRNATALGLFELCQNIHGYILTQRRY
jgi:hypothetical protein